MAKLQVGTRVKHNFSLDRGTVRKVRENEQGYSYFVEWDHPQSKGDWYRAEVLEAHNG